MQNDRKDASISIFKSWEHDRVLKVIHRAQRHVGCPLFKGDFEGNTQSRARTALCGGELHCQSTVKVGVRLQISDGPYKPGTKGVLLYKGIHYKNIMIKMGLYNGV